MVHFSIANYILFKEGQLHEDDLWTYKVMSVAKSIAIDKHITYYYRMRETSIMGSNSNLEKKTISLYTTVDYILHHQDKHDNNDFETIAQTYIGKYIGYALGSKVNFFRQYLEIRKNYKYYPIIRYLKGGLTLMDIKHKFHYVLSPRLGYLYLMLRRQKLNQK